MAESTLAQEDSEVQRQRRGFLREADRIRRERRKPEAARKSREQAEAEHQERAKDPRCRRDPRTSERCPAATREA